MRKIIVKGIVLFLVGIVLLSVRPAEVYPVRFEESLGARRVKGKITFDVHPGERWLIPNDTPADFLNLYSEGMHKFRQALTNERRRTKQFNYQLGHYLHSREMILDAAQKALSGHTDGEKVAVVLGAGHCMDIPLKELCEQFDRVVLVDLSIYSLRRIKEGGKFYATKQWSDGSIEIREAILSPELRNKIEIVVADISGIAVPLAKIFGEHSQDSGYLQNALQEVSPQDLPFADGEADLIVYSMVGSQYLEYPEMYLEQVTKERNAGCDFLYQQSWSMQRFQMLNNIAAYHMGEFYRILKPTGRLYYANDFMGVPIKETKEGDKTVNYPFLPSGVTVDTGKPKDKIMYSPREIIAGVSDLFYTDMNSEGDGKSEWLFCFKTEANLVEGLILGKKVNETSRGILGIFRRK